MKRVQFRISWFMASVVFIAIAYTATRTPSVIWASLIFMLMAVIMLTAALATCLRRGRARATWGGFALFSGFYFIVTFGPLPNGSGVSIPPLPPAMISDYLRANNPAEQAGWGAPNVPDARPFQEPMQRNFSLSYPPMPGSTGATVEPLNWIHLRRVVHSLGVLVFGFIGAGIGSRLTLSDQATGIAPHDSEQD